MNLKDLARILVALIFGTLSTATFASAATTPLKTAGLICSLVQADPAYAYASIFDPVIASRYPEAKVTGLLRKYFREHGSCTGVKLGTTNGQGSKFETEFVDGYRADLFISVGPSGLVNRFLFGGALPSSSVVKVREFQVRMRDGVQLRTLVYEKNDGKRKPALIERTPYLSGSYGMVLTTALYSALASHYVENGYAYVIQGIRGTGGSGGEFYFVNPQEADDGYDAVTWIAGQDFSNGSVGALGGSYDGYTAIAAATANPPALKVVVASSYITQLDSYGANYNGVLGLFNLQYLNYVTRSQGSALELFDGLTPDVVAKLKATPDLRQYDKILYSITIPEWQRIAENYPLSPTSAFWQSRSILERLPDIHIPTYHLAGMSEAGDGDGDDTIRAFEYLQQNGGTGDLHHLVVGYWTHPATPQKVPVLQARADRWFEHYLRNAPLAPEPTVVFAEDTDPNTAHFMSSNHYPPSSLVTDSLYLTDERLSSTRPALESRSSFSMDPSEDNSAVNNDPGVLSKSNKIRLVYSQPMDWPTTFAGNMTMHLNLSVSSAQGDVFIVVMKEDSKGKLSSIGMTARKIFWQATATPYEFEIGPLLTHFEPGDKLHLILTSNLFPLFVRNTGSGFPNYYQRFSPSEVTVDSSPDAPSYITFGKKLDKPLAASVGRQLKD